MNEKKLLPVINQAMLDGDLALQLFLERDKNSFLERVKSSNLELFVLCDSLKDICEKSHYSFNDVSSFLIKNSIKLIDPNKNQRESILNKLENLKINEWWSNLESLYAIELNINWIITEQPENFRGNHDLKVYTVEDVSTLEDILFIRYYKIIRYLSEGGFGKTYLVEDTHIHLPAENRRVIKQLKPITHDPERYEIIKKRFKKEAEVLEKLGKTHSQIPTLYGYFEQEGNFYLVQEYIEGKTLNQVIEEQGTLDATKVENFFYQLLKILDYLQKEGVIHRDIKPENIILRESDESPVLLDFGTVKEVIKSSLNSSEKTTSAIGTLGFMPPEQVAGRPVFASDIYALGLTGIYLLTGKRPQQLEIDPNTGKLLWEKETSKVSRKLTQTLNQAISFNPDKRLTTESQVMSQMNSYEKASSLISLIIATIALLALFATVNNVALNVWDRIVDKDGQTAVTLPETVTDETNEDLEAKKQKLEEELRVVKQKLAELQTDEKRGELERQLQEFQREIREIWKASCGSPVGSGSVWYAVVGDSNALRKVKSQYCRDALIVGGNTQVAVFTSYSHAENFAQYLTRETGYNFWVKKSD